MMKLIWQKYLTAAELSFKHRASRDLYTVEPFTSDEYPPANFGKFIAIQCCWLLHLLFLLLCPVKLHPTSCFSKHINLHLTQTPRWTVPPPCTLSDKTKTMVIISKDNWRNILWNLIQILISIWIPIPIQFPHIPPSTSPDPDNSLPCHQQTVVTPPGPPRPCWYRYRWERTRTMIELQAKTANAILL